jgi:6-phosphogluconolactonase
MTSYAYDASKGTLTEVMTLPTLPAKFHAYSSCAEVQISPDGAFLYGSNRGDDSLVIYAVEGNTGRLTLVGHESTRGRIPRNFVVSPTGDFVAAANQDTNNIIMFRRDKKTGKLTPTGNVAEAGTPICIKYLGA